MTDREEAAAPDTHDASTCDAFPLAVGLAQAQARYAKLEALADRLAEALGETISPLEWDRQTVEALEALAAYTFRKING